MSLTFEEIAETHGGVSVVSECGGFMVLKDGCGDWWVGWGNNQEYILVCDGSVEQFFRALKSSGMVDTEESVSVEIGGDCRE